MGISCVLYDTTDLHGENKKVNSAICSGIWGRIKFWGGGSVSPLGFYLIFNDTQLAVISRKHRIILDQTIPTTAIQEAGNLGIQQTKILRVDAEPKFNSLFTPYTYFLDFFNVFAFDLHFRQQIQRLETVYDTKLQSFCL